MLTYALPLAHGIMTIDAIEQGSATFPGSPARNWLPKNWRAALLFHQQFRFHFAGQDVGKTWKFMVF